MADSEPHLVSYHSSPLFLPLEFFRWDSMSGRGGSYDFGHVRRRLGHRVTAPRNLGAVGGDVGLLGSRPQDRLAEVAESPLPGRMQAPGRDLAAEESLGSQP